MKVHEYSAVFEEDSDGGYAVWVPSLPGCASQGDTLEEAMTNIKEAIELFLEDDDVKWADEPEFARQFVVPIRVNA